MHSMHSMHSLFVVIFVVINQLELLTSNRIIYRQSQQQQMGNQTQPPSKFSNPHQWLTIAKTHSKELIQNKLTRQLVENHRLHESQIDYVRHDDLVYEWRKDRKTANYVVEILEMVHFQEAEGRTCMGVCHNSNKPNDLLIYTENLLKLYEMNSKVQLSEGDQVGIFKDIILGIDILSQRFGQFLPSKDSIGYNAKKRGKVWINDNFCCNTLQHKRPVKSKEERIVWEREVVQSIVEICKLCTTQNNYTNNKFYFLLECIKKKNFDRFSAVRDFKGPQRTPDSEEYKEISKIPSDINPNASKDAELADSHNIASSNEFITTQDLREKKANHEQYAIINKTYDIPVVMVRQSNQLAHLNNHTTYNYQNPQKIRFSHQEEKAGANQKQRQVQQSAYARQKHVEFRKNKFNSYTGESYFDQKQFYPKKQHHHQTSQIKEKPAHYALLEQLYESRSSRSQSKMIQKQSIPMIDSVQMIQNRHEYDHFNAFHKFRNTVMEESIVLRAPRR